MNKNKSQAKPYLILVRCGKHKEPADARWHKHGEYNTMKGARCAFTKAGFGLADAVKAGVFAKIVRNHQATFAE